MRMLRWTLDISLKDHKWNEDICRAVDVANITQKFAKPGCDGMGMKRREEHVSIRHKIVA